MKPKNNRSADTSHLAEPPEPVAARNPVPIWSVILFGGLFYLGQMYLELTGGGYEAQVYEPYASLKQVQAVQPKGDGDKFLAMGKQVYEGTCMLCHQANGMGVANQFPPLAGSEWVNSPGVGRLTRIVLHGVSGPLEVKGVKWEAAMPPFGSVFSDEQIAAVLTYIRQNKDWGNTGSPVKTEQIAAIRQATGERAPWSSDELLKVPEAE